MANQLIPIVDYLAPVALGFGGNYDPNLPRLGTKGTAVLGQPPASDAFAVVRTLTKEEHARYETSVDDLAKYRAARQVIQIALLNAEEFETSVSEIEKSYSSELMITKSWVSKLMILLNQRMLNFLSSMRTYLDHAETRLKRKYGDTSAEAKDFAAATAKEFDNSFAYRFMYKLRNYTQHCGMPLGYIFGISTLPTPLPDETPVHQIDFTFSRDELLQNFPDGWGKIVKPELQALPERFPLRAYMSEVRESLHRIDTVVRDIDKRNLAGSLGYLQQLQNEIGPTEGTACIYTVLKLTIDGEQWKSEFDYSPFPVDVMAELALEIELKVSNVKPDSKIQASQSR